MIYTVVWKPTAETELAALWLNAADRKAVAAAADQIDLMLRTDPDARSCGRRSASK